MVSRTISVSSAASHVVDVVDEGDRIAHVLSAPLGATNGSSIAATIDWERRFDHMQQHTGQHLLSAVFDDLFGCKTMSVHFGPDYSTLDLDSRIDLTPAARRRGDARERDRRRLEAGRSL